MGGGISTAVEVEAFLILRVDELAHKKCGSSCKCGVNLRHIDDSFGRLPRSDILTSKQSSLQSKQSSLQSTSTGGSIRELALSHFSRKGSSDCASTSISNSAINFDSKR